jgi:hypothetical protein
MKKETVAVLAFLVGAAPAVGFAQQGNWRGTPPAGGPPAPAHFPGGPPRGPAPMRTPPTQRRPMTPPPRGPAPPPPRVVERPHVDHHAHWVGHESGRGDARFHVEHPWAHGHYRGPIGRGHVYRISGWQAPRHRFWFGSSYFVVGEPDWGYLDDWNWDADQVVLYDDPDHPGWYLAYNARLGTYVHVTYDGDQ